MRVSWTSYAAGTDDPYVTLENAGDLITGRVLITGVTNGTTAAGTVVSGINSTDATELWAEGAWSEKNGYPSAIAWHESRFFFGGSLADPSTIWASKSDDFYNFEEGTNDDMAFHRLMATTELTSIVWMASHQQLYIGTNGEEWRGVSDSDSGIITPASFVLRRISNSGSELISPIFAGASVIHVQRQGRSLYSIGYNAASASPDGYAPSDLNQLAPHVTRGGITSVAFQSIRDSIIWATTGDGLLIGLTYDMAQNIAAWHEHDTKCGEFQSVAVVYESGNEDSVYVSVKRGSDYVIERMSIDQYELLENQGQEDGIFVDSAVKVTGSALTSITGLSHLEGKTLQVVTDGIYQGDFEVSGGAITGLSAFSIGYAGYAINSVMETLPFQFSTGEGSSIGTHKVVKKLTARVYRSVTLDAAISRYGTNRWTSMQQAWRLNHDPVEKQVEGLIGGFEDWTLPVAGSRDSDARLAIRITDPYPLNILALAPDVEV